MFELKAIAKQVCNGTATKEERDYVIRCWEKAFNRKFKRCKCQICDALFEILNKKIMTGRYRLKKGVCIIDPKDPTKMLNYKTQRDDLAIHHLKLNPANIRYFDIIPANYKDDIYGKKVTKTEQKKEIVKTEEPVLEPKKAEDILPVYKEEKPKKKRYKKLS